MGGGVYQSSRSLRYRGAMSEKTLFERIIDRELPAQFVHEDDRCIAIRDLHPAAPEHLLVIPKKPIDRIQNMDAADKELIGHLFWVAGRIALDQGFEDAYRVVINNGAGAGQTVFHLHVHLLSGRDFSWPPG